MTASPIDMMVQLDDIGLDYTKIDDFELFAIMFDGVKRGDTSLLFGDLDISGFRIGTDEKGGVVLVDPTQDIVIDRRTYEKISGAFRTIHNIEKNTKKPGNEAARTYLLARERKKLARRKRHGFQSQLDPLIISMVNTQQFKYDFEGTRELSIYQFNESVRQIINKVDFDNRMIGVYTGNISTKDLKKEELSWLKQAG